MFNQALKAALAASALISGMMPLSASATLFGVSNQPTGQRSSLYTIDPSTGTANFVANLTGGFPNNSGLSFLGGTLYGSDIFATSGNTRVGTIDTTTGVYTGINNQGGSGNWWGLASNESAGLLYAYDNEGGALSR
jgi:hypothetical protein